MRTVEERLEVAQLKNKLLLELLEGQLGSEAIERLKVMLSCMDKVSDEDPKYFEGFVKRVEDNSND